MVAGLPPELIDGGNARLTAEQARAMVQVRGAQRAYRTSHARCFWWCPPGLAIGPDDVAWVAEQLMKHGGRRGWERWHLQE